MHLVHDHQARPGLRAIAVQDRLGGDLGVRRDVALRPLAHRAHGVGQVRVEPQAQSRGRVGPLPAQVIGGHDDDDAVHHPLGEQSPREGEGERRLARSGRRGDEEVPGVGLGVPLEGADLPAAQVGRLGCLGEGGHGRYDPGIAGRRVAETARRDDRPW